MAGHLVSVELEGGEVFHGSIWEFNVKEGYITIVGDTSREIQFDEIKEGTIEGMFHADGKEKKNLHRYIIERQQRCIKHKMDDASN